MNTRHKRWAKALWVQKTRISEKADRFDLQEHYADKKKNVG